MSKDFGGLKEVAYSDTKGGTRTSVAGKISGDSSINPDNTATETTEGGSLYGGSSVAPEIFFLDHDDYETIKGFMVNDTEKFWHFIFKDGHELSTEEAINPFVTPGDGINVRDGVVAWVMDFERFHHAPILDRTPAP